MDMIYKIIVIGDPRVGKTSLLTKFATQKFDDIYLPTIGANITKQQINIDATVISMMVWDIAGQQEFYEVYKSYYNGSNGVIIVYDVTRRDTFDNIESWYEECANNGIGHIPMIIVGNKIDLDREVDKNDAENIADSLSAKYFETSAKEDINVNDIFSEVAFDVHEYITGNKIQR